MSASVTALLLAAVLINVATPEDEICSRILPLPLARMML